MIDFGDRLCTLLGVASLVLVLMQQCLGGVDSDRSTRLKEITVEGRRDVAKTEMRQFVEHVTRPDFLGRSLARWLQPVCPAAYNLPREQGEYVLARISTIAVESKIPLSKDSGCVPNLFVVFSHDPHAYLGEFAKKHPFFFANGGRSGATDGTNMASAHRVNHFLDTQVPVRVWYNTAESQEFGRADVTGFAMVTPGETLRYREHVHAASPRLWYGAVESFENIVVVVDTAMTQGMKLATVVDYAAMVGLMELQPEAKVGDAPSILGAFSGGQGRAVSLTDWDAAFLSGLYATEQFSRFQRSLIVDRMVSRVMP